MSYKLPNKPTYIITFKTHVRRVLRHHFVHLLQLGTPCRRLGDMNMSFYSLWTSSKLHSLNCEISNLVEGFDLEVGVYMDWETLDVNRIRCFLLSIKHT